MLWREDVKAVSLFGSLSKHIYIIKTSIQLIIKLVTGFMVEDSKTSGNKYLHFQVSTCRNKIKETRFDQDGVNEAVDMNVEVRGGPRESVSFQIHSSDNGFTGNPPKRETQTKSI